MRNRLPALLLSLALALTWQAYAACAQTVVASTGQTVTTGETSRQILFRDKTSVSAGPNSSVTVTRANYDAQTGSGNVVITVTRGAFRYITGDSAGTHTIKTPLSTVGVRGTVIEGYVANTGHEVFVLIEGAFSVTPNHSAGTTSGSVGGSGSGAGSGNGAGSGSGSGSGAGRTVDVTQPGTFVVVSPGSPITLPTPMTNTMRSAMLMSAPTLNLLRDTHSETMRSGRDPIVTFRESNQATASTTFQAPPPPCVNPPRGPPVCP